MSRSAWDDLREDARAFQQRYPSVGHTLFYIPDLSARGVRELGRAAVHADLVAADSTTELVSAMIRQDEGFSSSDDPSFPDWLNFGTLATVAAPQWHPSSSSNTETTTSYVCVRTGVSLVARECQKPGDDAPVTDEWVWRTSPSPAEYPDASAWEELRSLLTRFARLLPDRQLVTDAAWDASTPAPGLARGLVEVMPRPLRLLHWLAWSGNVNGLRADVAWKLENDPKTHPYYRVESRVQRITHPRGYPEPPSPLEKYPLACLAGWWWSTIDDAGAAIVSAVDFLKPQVDTHLPNGNVENNNALRPRRTTLTPNEREAKITDFLKDNRAATRDEIAKAIGVGAATVSGSEVWKRHSKARKDAAAQNRAARQGIGGVGDPSTDFGGGG